jgi:hypothetical protein
MRFFQIQYLVCLMDTASDFDFYQLSKKMARGALE